MRNFRKSLGGVAVVLVLALVLGACNNSSKSKKKDTPPKDGSDTVITIDASDYNNFVYFNLDTLEEVDVANPKTSTDWHIGFKRAVIVLNGGDSGAGVTSAALAKAQNSFYSGGEPIISRFLEATPASEKAVFDEVKNAAGLTFMEDTYVGAVGNGWYSYNDPDPSEGTLTWKVSQQAWISSSLSPSHDAGAGATKDVTDGFVFPAAAEYCTGTTACLDPWIYVDDVTLGEFDVDSGAVSYQDGQVTISVTPDFILQGDGGNPTRRQFHPSLVGNFTDDPIFSTGALAASLTAHFRESANNQPAKAPDPITVSFPSSDSVTQDDSLYWIVRSAAGNSYARFRVTDMVQSGVNVLEEITIELGIQGVGQGSFAAPITETLNIADADEPVCYDIDAAETVSCSGATWDLRFGDGLSIYLNSGIYGGGNGAAFGPLASDELAAFSTGAAVPNWVSDGARSIFDEKSWYAYNLEGTHQLYANYRVYVVDTGVKDIKAQILSYYSKEGAGGHYSIRVGELK